METIKIIIVDDHPLIKEGIKQILSLHQEMEIVAEGSDGKDAIFLSESVPCDILLLDINMPVTNGIDALKIIRQSNSNIKILLLTVENDFHTLKEAIDLKVNGYILKESAGTTLVDAINHVYEGGNYIDQILTKKIFNIVQDTAPSKFGIEPVYFTDSFKNLTQREIEILLYISKGLSNKEIASKLFLSDKTIRNALTVLFKKIGVKDRVQATIYAINNNIQGNNF